MPTILPTQSNDPADAILITSAEDKKRIEKIVPIAINVITLDEVFEHYGLTRAALGNNVWLYRIPCINYLLEMEYDNVLSIDADALVLGDISEVWEKAAQNVVAACSDIYGFLGNSDQYLHEGMPIGNYANLLAMISSSPRGEKFLRMMGVTKVDAHKWTYINAGIICIHNCPTGISICKRFIRDVPLQVDLISHLNFGDQDYLNTLFCKMQINAAVLEPMKYNHSHTKHPDRRIIHFNGVACRERITWLWTPYINKVIKPALRRIGLSYRHLIRCILPDPTIPPYM